MAYAGLDEAFLAERRVNPVSRKKVALVAGAMAGAALLGLHSSGAFVEAPAVVLASADVQTAPFQVAGSSEVAEPVELNESETSSHRDLISQWSLFLGRGLVCLYFLKWGSYDNFMNRDSKQSHAEGKAFGNEQFDEHFKKVPGPVRLAAMVLLPLVGSLMLLLGHSLPGTLLLLCFFMPSVYWQYNDSKHQDDASHSDGTDDKQTNFMKNLSVLGLLFIFLGLRITALGAIMVLFGRFLWTSAFWHMGMKQDAGLPELETNMEKAHSIFDKELPIIKVKVAKFYVVLVRGAAIEGACLGIIAVLGPLFDLSRFCMIASNICIVVYMVVHTQQSLSVWLANKGGEKGDGTLDVFLRNLCILGGSFCLIAYEF
mmetsp:Transcript_36858/g.88705  ORF Transcript_36858/g.88705 Transcript_36858/m.88705 type:complete len:372 (-) Transcript_36858:230-1345(-)